MRRTAAKYSSDCFSSWRSLLVVSLQILLYHAWLHIRAVISTYLRRNLREHSMKQFRLRFEVFADAL